MRLLVRKRTLFFVLDAMAILFVKLPVVLPGVRNAEQSLLLSIFRCLNHTNFLGKFSPGLRSVMEKMHTQKQIDPSQLLPLTIDEQLTGYAQQILEAREKLVQLGQFPGFKTCLEIVGARKHYNVAISELLGPFVDPYNILKCCYTLDLLEKFPLDPKLHPVQFFREEVATIRRTLAVPFYHARIFEKKKDIEYKQDYGTKTSDKYRITDLELDLKEDRVILADLELLYKGALALWKLHQLEVSGFCQLGKSQEEAV